MSSIPESDLEHILRHTEGLWEDLRGQSLFLTGGTGFVGRWLLESVLWANERLALRVSVAVLSRNPEGFRESTPHLAGHPSIQLIRGHVAEFEFPEGAYPFVIHAATERPFQPDPQQPLGSFGADIEGTRRVLEFARSHGVRRLLFTSSGAVYGKQPAHLTHIPEDYAGAPATTDPGSAYGQAKRVSESMCAMYGRAFGFEATISRLFTFVGPHLPLDDQYAIGNFIGDLLGGRPVRIRGDGTPYRSYLYAADMSIWLWTILLRGRGAHPYNVGSSRDMTIADLARTVVRVIEPGARIEVGAQAIPGSPPLRYVPSTGRAQDELALRELVSAEEGVRRTFAFYQQAEVEPHRSNRRPTSGDLAGS